ncbi:hypothetical protein CCHR01_18233 [Colletotrichum chrysophilum]|uniref:Uncharacterized protein n=1 Tax=Colletotrichum chrysophilum TaxID=1836956 RepID=A0AAD9A0G5_9PEZI|nr:hypothetical protein CCHR01_18233 [Colletotrichum chrysophilum]
MIFCTTPSTTALFPSEWLASEFGRSKHRFVSAAIGSYDSEMQEIDPCLLCAITDSTADSLPGFSHP